MHLVLHRIPSATKIFLLHHLSVMLHAGIPIGKALDALATHAEQRGVRAMLLNVKGAVERGKTLSEAIAAFPDLFPPIVTALLRAGEASGALDAALQQATAYLKKERELRNRVRSALLYPIVVVSAMAVIGTGIVVYVLPRLLTLFQDVTAELPASTRALLWLARVVQTHGILIALVILLGIGGIAAWTRTEFGRRTWHPLVLRLGRLGRLIREVNIARLTRTLSGLLKTDIRIVPALELAASTVRSIPYRVALLDAAREMSRGGTLESVLARSPQLFPATVLQLVGVGEASGSLGQLLGELADFYEADVDESLRGLTTIIEPILILTIGAAVAFLAVSVLMPIYSVAQAI